ncbi:hypothetical protein JB92DRAFT_2827758 [Gautieria morchelliformis]|nr:hypothetical protein JB92DRAFT_2827758 [Gautieria morchelliformis]
MEASDLSEMRRTQFTHEACNGSAIRGAEYVSPKACSQYRPAVHLRLRVSLCVPEVHTFEPFRLESYIHLTSTGIYSFPFFGTLGVSSRTFLPLGFLAYTLSVFDVALGMICPTKNLRARWIPAQPAQGGVIFFGSSVYKMTTERMGTLCSQTHLVHQRAYARKCGRGGKDAATATAFSNLCLRYAQLKYHTLGVQVNPVQINHIPKSRLYWYMSVGLDVGVVTAGGLPSTMTECVGDEDKQRKAAAAAVTHEMGRGK